MTKNIYLVDSRKKIQELYTFTEINNIDIIPLGETSINSKTLLKLQNHHVYRQDRLREPTKPPSGGNQY